MSLRSVTGAETCPPEDRPYWLAWAQIHGLGPHRLKRLFQQFGSLQAAWLADEKALMQVEGIGTQLASTIREERQRLDPEALLQQADPPDCDLITPADSHYPPLLWELPDPPPYLYLLGEQPQWHPTVGIVGTRSPTAYGRRWTEKVAAALAEVGFVVVSGLAAGIDGVAHQACLQAGGITLAVLGTGVDQVYPAQHRRLAEQIKTRGALISEFPPGTLPAKENFPRRNRIIAGLCPTVLVMEAPEKSGALITAYLANNYNRDVYALPGPIDTAAARGCLKLIQSGAGMILSVEELLEQLGTPLASNTAVTQTDPGAHLEGSERLIWQHLSHEPMSLDTLAQLTQLDIQTLSSSLLMLELEGLVIQVPGLRYQRSAGAY